MKSKTQIIEFLVLLLLILVLLGNFASLTDLSRDTASNFSNFQSPHPSSETNPEVEWFQRWDNGDGDKGFDVIIDKANNILVVGSTDLGAGLGEDIIIIKYNQSGYQLWNSSWNIRDVERAYAVTLDSSDNLYVVGKTGDFGTNKYDIFLTKFNNEGQHNWTRIWGNNYDDSGYDVTLDSDNNIYIVGETNQPSSLLADMCLIKYDNLGNYLWNSTFGVNDRFEVAYGVCVANNTNDVYVVGETRRYDSDGDMILISYDSSGNEQWNKTWGAENRDVGYDVEIHSDKYIYVAGESFADSLLMKYNLSGNLEWYRTWGDLPSEQVASGITIDTDENVYLTGYSGLTGDNDIFILKYNSTGEKIWDKIWGLSNREEGENIAVDSDFNLFVVGWGTTPYDLLLYKIEQYAPEVFQASHNADDPDTDGAFYLTWNDSVRALTYSVYQYDKPITEINGSLIVIGINLINNSLYVSNLETGVWFFKILAFNLIGNSSSNTLNVTVVLPPEIFIISPFSNQVFGFDPPEFNITLEGLDLDVLWYTIDNGTTNYPILGNGTIDPNQWESMEDGFVHIQFFLNNTHGNTSTEDVYVIKDTVSPNLTILSPVGSNLYGKNPPFFDVEITDPHLDQMWYSLNNGKNFSFTVNSTFDPTEWDNLPNGTVRITFHANDTVGNEGSTYIDVFIDIVPPSIVIYSPYQNQLFGSLPPNFMVRINDSNLVSMWYSLEGGSFVTFTENGTFDLSVWNSLANGSVSINFIANDTAGNFFSRIMTVRKDIEKPIVSIHNPILNSHFGSVSPAYNISVFEGNLDKMWYTLDNGLYNITMSPLIGVINQQEWSTLPEGHITIRFYANDTLGNLGYGEVIVIKEITIEPSPDSPAIPGFNVITIFSLFLAISLLIGLSKKKISRYT